MPFFCPECPEDRCYTTCPHLFPDAEAEPDERCDLSCDDDRPDYVCPFRAKYGYCYEDKLQEIRKGVVE